ncbi:hypothetical protein [Streptomyces sp. ISL-86]|uniref:hypothetical protein n=1 Tax=Streptomyces sp. ISL-86 TaxID=2819187 RepID=UPI001BEC4891|nr:hypothetical protein [Streptomyces sp. ISL-86]MBT2457699.1 hypothetical protein [Streptomyces sp. ISL-86]
MGRLFDKWMGTKYPYSGVTPLPAAEVRYALLALNGPDVPFTVRNGTPKEGADLVAECRIPKLGLTLKTRMRLIPAAREVRALDERWETGSHEHSGARYGRGQATTVYKEWEFKEGPDGRRRMVETFRFDTRAIKDPLRNTVLGSGWTWRGVMRRL